MKKYYLLLFVFFTISSVSSQIINFQDANFKLRLLNSLGTAFDSNQLSIQVDANADGEIQVSEAQAVYYLNLNSAQISSLVGIEYFINLRSLVCQFNQITTLDVSNLVNLTVLACDANQIATLNTSGLINLEQFSVADNLLTSLNLNGLTSLKDIRCLSNQLTSINVNGLPSLLRLDCSANAITTLSISNLNAFQELHCDENTMTSLALSNLPNLGYLSCTDNLLTTLNLTGLLNLQFLNCLDNQIANLTNLANLVNLTTLNCSNNQLTTLNVSNSQNLDNLDCSNNQIANLNITGLNNLHYLYCGNNVLNTIDLTSLSALYSLRCNDNQLTTLQVSNAPDLYEIWCFNNLLTALTVTNLLGLDDLYCHNNQIAALDLSGGPNLKRLGCWSNNLSMLNVSALTQLQFLNCNTNHIVTLDLNNQTELQTINCNNNNELVALFIKNSRMENVSFSGNPNLEYICADENQIIAIQNQIDGYGYTNCHVNSYCTFSPGGAFYTIQGNNKYDGNTNGCDSNDIAYPNLKLAFTSGTTTVNLIPDVSGNYHYDVQAGLQTIQPIIENPAYFNVSPTPATVTFPTAASPFTQNFCITANGTHNDLEVVVLPLSNARSGFDANYKITYKNKGTTTQSGAVNFAFDDSILDLVSATPSLTNQTVGNLTWSFSNLLPFETRQIYLTLNVNSATDIPAVNSGDVLNYTATITGLTDETPSDNSALLNQTVVNSLDPNDKTCLEGNTITPNMVGEYVHYMIRFENNGTANAENIVIMDRIDVSRYEINSLFTISSSHSFTTRITETNKVEFIFENINLPFDNANNDGYVAFKIKTKPTLVVGDTFSNSANIYFDYNFPIVTNTETTTIQALENPDFEFATYFTIVPNPANEVLNIETKNDVQVSSVNIYNTLGQLILVVTEPTAINVSSLKTGNYFIKVISDKGTTVSKFIKN